MLNIKSSHKKVVPPEYSNIWWLKIITGVFLFSFILLSGYVIWITYYSTFRIAEYGIDVISLEQAQVEPINFNALERAKKIDMDKKNLTPPLTSRNVFFIFSQPQALTQDETDEFDNSDNTEDFFLEVDIETNIEVAEPLTEDPILE